MAKEQALSTNGVFVFPTTWRQHCYGIGVNNDMLCLVGLLSRHKRLVRSDYYFIHWALHTSSFPVFDFKLHKYYNYKQCLLVSLLPNMFVVGRDASRLGKH